MHAQTMGLACLLMLMMLTPPAANAFDEQRTVPMREDGGYYVRAHVSGLGELEVMVDTGSSYSVLDARTLERLRRRELATRVGELTGVMADGRRKTVPLYRITRMRIGEHCVLRNVEVAVLAERSRPILGMSALRKTAPFVFSVDPPRLRLGRCDELDA